MIRCDLLWTYLNPRQLQTLSTISNITQRALLWTFSQFYKNYSVLIRIHFGQQISNFLFENLLFLLYKSRKKSKYNISGDTKLIFHRNDTMIT